LSNRFGVAIEHLGWDESATLRGELCGQGVDPLDLEFAFQRLGHFAAGANRNLLLLWTAGERILTLDDDVVCDVWSLPHTSDALVFSGHADPRHGEFFRTRADVLAAIAPVEADLIAAHEKILGATLSSVVERAPRLELGEACQHLVDLLRDNTPASVVRLTFAGIAGDAGVYCPYRMLFRRAPVTKRLSEDASAYQVAMSSREGLRIAHSYTVTHDVACMAACVGMDNSALLPPFMPMGRNEDGVFGATVSLMDDRAVSAHVPFGVIHDSGRPADYGQVRMPSASETRLSDVLLAFYSRSAPALTPRGAPSSRLHTLGSCLSAVANLDIREFRISTTRMLLEERSRDLKSGNEEPSGEHWRTARDAYRRTLADAVIDPEFFVASECMESSLQEGFDATQRFVARFGKLLSAWPVMWDAARRRNTIALSGP
jgi:hypothetical protein